MADKTERKKKSKSGKSKSKSNSRDSGSREGNHSAFESRMSQGGSRRATPPDTPPRSVGGHTANHQHATHHQFMSTSSGIHRSPTAGFNSSVFASSARPFADLSNKSSGMLRHADSRIIDSSMLTTDHHIIAESIQENEVRVPKRVVREEVREKVIVVPETVQVEEIIEETVKVREKIIEVAKPIYHEKIVEVPEYEYVEKIVEVPETIIQEKIHEIPRVEIVERVSRVPKIVVQEKVVEVPEYEYREVEIEKIVEVPEIREEIVYKEVKVDQIVEVPVPEYHTVEVPHDIDRYLPVPVEAVTYYEFRLPKMTAKYNKKPYPVYAPRFIEVPIPTSAIDDPQMNEVNFVLDNVKSLCNNPCPNLCEIEKLAEYAKTRNYNFQINENLLQKKFTSGQL